MWQRPGAPAVHPLPAEAEVARLTRERDEAVEQQTAAFKVLEIINSSAGNLHPVFAAMLENAVRICDAKFGSIYRWDDDALSFVATHNTPPALVAVRRRVFLNPKLPFGRMAAIKTAVQVADLAAEEAYFDQRDPTMVAADRTWRRAHVAGCTNAQGERADWCYQRFPPGSSSLYFQADCAAHELRPSSCRRN